MTRPNLRLSAISAVVLAATLIACAAPPSRTDRGAQAASSGSSAQASGSKRIVAAITGDLPVLNNKVIRATLAYSAPGGAEVEDLITDGLVDLDDQGVLHAKLAEAVPSTENGLWRVLPDGRMETTWKIRENARWHDGNPVTTDDLLFTMMVVRDRDIPLFRDTTYELIEKVEASDARTITATWNQPYIQADLLFSRDLGLPLPKHILEAPYREDKVAFSGIPYWNSEFIGAGPFRVKSFSLGTSVTLAAFDNYVLGRPKIDEIEVRFIPDTGTLLANVFSGVVEATMGRGISLEQALQSKELWPAGQPLMGPNSWIVIFPQFLDPTPTAVGDVRFRKALMYALDRQQMVDTIQAGLIPVAHAFLNPKDPDFPAIQNDAVRYDYDPRQAARLIEEMGQTRAADGLYRDASGQRLTAEIWTSGGLDIQVKSMFSTADQWKQAGVDAEPIIVAPQRWNDREYVAKFPAFRMNRQPNSLTNLKSLQTAQTPLPTNNYVGQNYSRYMNPEFDALIDRYFTTIPKAERTRALGDVVRHMTDQLTLMGLYYDVQPALVANRISGVTPETSGWNAHLWEIR